MRAGEPLRFRRGPAAKSSVAPAVEAQMGHGQPVTGRLRRAGVTTGLGVDVVTSVPGDMFALMRATLLASHVTDDPSLTVRDVLRMATIDWTQSSWRDRW